MKTFSLYHWMEMIMDKNLKPKLCNQGDNRDTRTHFNLQPSTTTRTSIISGCWKSNRKSSWRSSIDSRNKYPVLWTLGNKNWQTEKLSSQLRKRQILKESSKHCKGKRSWTRSRRSLTWYCNREKRMLRMKSITSIGTGRSTSIYRTKRRQSSRMQGAFWMNSNAVTYLRCISIAPTRQSWSLKLNHRKS